MREIDHYILDKYDSYTMIVVIKYKNIEMLLIDFYDLVGGNTLYRWVSNEITQVGVDTDIKDYSSIYGTVKIVGIDEI
jgi:hypothetical protein